MADRTDTFRQATEPKCFKRIGHIDHWRVLDRDTGAEIAVTVDRSVHWPEPRVIGLIIQIEGRTVASGADMLPPWARRNARTALVAAKSLARADAASWRARQAYGSQVLREVAA
ncbi:MAG: hypothetical protein AAF170_14630 [Bacteroidota bacterium]